MCRRSRVANGQGFRPIHGAPSPGAARFANSLSSRLIDPLPKLAEGGDQAFDSRVVTAAALFDEIAQLQIDTGRFVIAAHPPVGAQPNDRFAKSVGESHFAGR